MSSSSDPNAWPPFETAQSTLLGLIAFTAAIAPLGLPTLVVLLFLLTLAQNQYEGSGMRPVWRTLMTEPAHLAALAFFLFAALSSAWSAHPLYGLRSIAQCGLVALSAWYIATALDQQMRTIGPERRTRFTRAIPIAAPFIGFYFLLDALTADGATLFFARNFPWIFDGMGNAIVYSKDRVPIGFDEIYFNRIAAALVLITAGITAAFRFWPRPSWGPVLAITTAIGMILICLKSGSATALLTSIIAVGVFALAVWSSRRTLRLLQVTFLVLTFAAIPLSMLPMKAGLDTNTKLPFSFRQRVIIWNDLSHLALTRPWFGIGVKSVKSMTQWPSEMSGANKPRKEPQAYVHPHNGYLQVWLEMGLMGAVLFALAGTFLLGLITRLMPAMQPFALAMAGATMTMIGPGWELWQPWLVAAIGSGWIALLLLRHDFEEHRSIWTLRD